MGTISQDRPRLHRLIHLAICSGLQMFMLLKILYFQQQHLPMVVIIICSMEHPLSLDQNFQQQHLQSNVINICFLAVQILLQRQHLFPPQQYHPNVVNICLLTVQILPLLPHCLLQQLENMDTETCS